MVENHTDRELEELDTYLNDEFNHGIYEELTDEAYEGIFEPLEFFQLFYAQVDFIRENKAKPLFVRRSLRKLDITEDQLFYLCHWLVVFFQIDEETDKQIKICRLEIAKLRDEFIDDEDNLDTPENKNPFDFDEVLNHLKTLKTKKEQVEYLIEIKTEYKQKQYWDYERPTFGEKCDFEISKISELLYLDLASKVPDKKQIVEIGKHKDLTIDRVILLFNRLIPAFPDCEATKKAEFISFLTGFDSETVRQRFSTIYRKDADKPQAFKKDMEIVCKYLEILGLDEIIRQIKKDLDFM